MRAIPISSAHPALQAGTPTPPISPTTSIARTALRHGSRVSLLAMSLMLAFPATSHAGGGGGEGVFASGLTGGAGAGYDGAGNPTTGGTAAGLGAAGGGGVGTAGDVGITGGGGGGGIGSIANAPSGLPSTTTGGSGGNSLVLAGGGGGGDGANLTSGGTLNVTVRGGDGGGGLTGGGGGTGLAFSTTSGATLTVQSAVTGGAGGAGNDGGGGGGSGIWVTANGAVDVTTGTVTGGSGGTSLTNDNGDGGGGVIFSGAGGQVHVGGSAQIVGGAASGSGTGGAGINLQAGGGTMTIDSGAIVAGGLGGTSAVIAVPGLAKGGIGSGGASGGDPTSLHLGSGGIGLIAAGGNNTIITSGAINGGTGLAGQAAAVRLNGGGNTLELRAGYSFIGSVVSISGGGDTLTLGGATNATFDAASIGVSGQYQGFNNFSKTGSSNWTLTGIGTFSGNTDISGGTLSVNGDFSSSAQINVNNGGALGGTGTVGNVTVNSGGILAPGNSIGTLHVNGDLVFNSGTIYRVEVDAAGSADRTDVTGNVALNGTVDVRAGAGSYAVNTAYTILTNTGVQSGTFAGVTSNLAFLTPTLSYLPNAVLLNLARNGTSFTDVANTHNQQAVANALQNVGAGATGDIGTVLNAVTNLSADQARASFDTMSGAGLISMRRANLSFAGGFNNQVIARLNAAGTAANVQQTAFNMPLLLAANDHVSDLMPMLAQQSHSLDGGAPQISAAASGSRGFWLRGYGSDQSTDGDANAAGSRQKDVGISAGVDAKVNDNLIAGFALTHDHAEVDAGAQNGESNGNAAALYGSYASGHWNVNGVLSYAHNSNSTQRRIAFGGIDRTAASDFGSRTLSLYGDVTYNMPLAGWTLQPLAGLSLSSNKANRFNETGADALNLQVAGQTVQSTKSLLGAKALIEVRKIQLQPRLIWAHEFGDADSAAMTAQLQGAPTPFAINGVDVPRDSLIAGLTIAGQASERVSVFSDVQEEFNSSQNKLGVLLGLRASW